MTYAARAQVPYTKTIAEIMALLRKSGALQVGQLEEENRLTILFAMHDRQVRFRVAWDQAPQSQRQRARALLLVIKAKLESIDSGVETFEQAFLANIVLSDGVTVHERVAGDLQLEYRGGQPRLYLLGGGDQG